MSGRDAEATRILLEYQRRARELPADYYSLTRPAVLFFLQHRTRAVLAALQRARQFPLGDRRILEVGCGRGDWLLDFEAWGAARSRLAGIDLDAARGGVARTRLCAERDASGAVLSPGADIRIGDAAHLPWDAGSFDIVVQSTVFSSVLDAGTRRAMAAEMSRVLAPRGIVLWYDFFVNNPINRNVRGVRAGEIRQLFPGCDVSLSRLTLASPLARRLVPSSWVLASLLERARLLNTHYLAVIRPRSTAA